MEVKFKINRDNDIVPAKAGRIGTTPSYDVHIGIRKVSSKSPKRRLGITLSDDIASRFSTGRIAVNLARYSGIERLYLLDKADGYVIAKGGGKRSRKNISVRIEDERDFYKYVGDHNLGYDEYNKAYFIELERS